MRLQSVHANPGHLVRRDRPARSLGTTTSLEMKNMAAIENRSGSLTCEKILGVPLANGHDQRWIDNFGSVGMPRLSLRRRGLRHDAGGQLRQAGRISRRARRSFANRWVSALGNSQRPCAVYCEEIPNQIVVANCELAGCAAVMVDKRLDLKTYFNGVRPGMLRFDVGNNAGEFAG